MDTPNDSYDQLPSGSHIHIEDWIGRLGNQMMQISAGLHLARQSRSLLTFPKHPIFRRNRFDFREKSGNRSSPVISGRFFLQKDCYQFPIRHDSVRRQIFQEYLYNYIACRSWFSDLLQRRLTRRWVPDDETLVINIRSGKDIFRENPPEDCRHYLQPPLSFYKYIIESHSYRKCIIVTESDRRNPVIPALLSWNSDIELIPHRSVRDDISMLLNARHLVTAHSSFSWCLALMSKNLRVLHQPFTCQVRGVRDFETNTYEFRDYFGPGEWCSTATQLAYMISHPLEKVARVEKAGDLDELSSAL